VLNQGFWSRFESWIRNFLLQTIFDEVVVITGPVFAPIFIDNKWVFVHRTVGTFPNLVQVPSHFFKVIIGRKNGSPSSVVAAFLVPNNESVDKAVLVSLVLLLVFVLSDYVVLSVLLLGSNHELPCEVEPTRIIGYVIGFSYSLLAGGSVGCCP
jgi:hypothetical protein